MRLMCCPAASGPCVVRKNFTKRKSPIPPRKLKSGAPMRAITAKNATPAVSGMSLTCGTATKRITTRISPMHAVAPMKWGKVPFTGT